jgi:hypothetical protein
LGYELSCIFGFSNFVVSAFVCGFKFSLSFGDFRVSLILFRAKTSAKKLHFILNFELDSFPPSSIITVKMSFISPAPELYVKFV